MKIGCIICLNHVSYVRVKEASNIDVWSNLQYDNRNRAIPPVVLKSTVNLFGTITLKPGIASRRNSVNIRAKLVVFQVKHHQRLMNLEVEIRFNIGNIRSAINNLRQANSKSKIIDLRQKT